MRVEHQTESGTATIWGEFGPGVQVPYENVIRWVHPESEEEKQWLFTTIINLKGVVDAYISEYKKQIDEQLQIAQEQLDKRYIEQLEQWNKRNRISRWIIPKPTRSTITKLSEIDLYFPDINVNRPKRPVSVDTERLIKQTTDYRLFYTPIPKEQYQEIINIVNRRRQNSSPYGDHGAKIR